jgi:hypothetical protein
MTGLLPTSGRSSLPLSSCPPDSLESGGVYHQSLHLSGLHAVLGPTDRDQPIIATWKRTRPTRHNLPDGVIEIVAVHVEEGVKIGEHRIRCKGNESPDEQTKLITNPYGALMDMSDWREERRHHTSIQQSSVNTSDVSSWRPCRIRVAAGFREQQTP